MVIAIIIVVVALYLAIGMIIGVKVLGASDGTTLLVLGLILAAIICVVFNAPIRADAAVLSAQQSTSSLDNDEAVVEEEGEVVVRHELIPSPVTGEYLERMVYGDHGGGNNIYYYYYLADDGTTVVQEDLWWPSTTIRVGKKGSKKAEYVEYVRHTQKEFLWGLIRFTVEEPYYVVTIPPKE